MTHLVTPHLGEVVVEGGSMVLETPLFLLQVKIFILSPFLVEHRCCETIFPAD